MKSPLPSFAKPMPAYRLAAVLLAAASLSACGGFGGGARSGGSATEAPRNINLPPVPKVNISEAARSDYAQALSYLNNGNDRAAERELRNMVTQYPEIAGPRINLATLLLERGDNEEALGLAREAIAANPRSAAGYNVLGMAERRAGNFDAARSAYQNALAADPGYDQAQLNLGILYDLYLRQPDRALAAYEAFQAAQAEPDTQVNIWIADFKRRAGGN